MAADFFSLHGDLMAFLLRGFTSQPKHKKENFIFKIQYTVEQFLIPNILFFHVF